MDGSSGLAEAREASPELSQHEGDRRARIEAYEAQERGGIDSPVVGILAFCDEHSGTSPRRPSEQWWAAHGVLVKPPLRPLHACH